ncbi:MAG: HlyD family efflux transporter periplasmic adaptor subunit [Planctomycetota bacterium]
MLQVLRESEGVVQAGEPIVEIGDPSALEVEVEVLSADAVRIQPGMRALLDRWGGETLEAVVRGVEPIGFTKVSALGVEEQRVRVIVDIRAPRETWRDLGDGYRVEATFVLWEGSDVLLVPNSALFRGDEGWQVYVYEDGVARARKVDLGKRGGLFAQVEGGLEPGARVITHPDDQVSDGTAVRPRD